MIGNMLVIGLTGPTGAGKSLLDEVFTESGIPVIDTDRISREVSAPGTECLSELVDHFGDRILLPDGRLDRKALSELVFKSGRDSAVEREALNLITHRHILLEVDRRLAEYAEKQCFAAVIDAPLLFESGCDCKCDITIAVIAPADMRVERIMKRDGISRWLALGRLAAQHDDGFYESRCDTVFGNDGDAEMLKFKVREYVKKLKNGKAVRQ